MRNLAMINSVSNTGKMDLVFHGVNMVPSHRMAMNEEGIPKSVKRGLSWRWNWLLN